jgi:hypothetical protein
MSNFYCHPGKARGFSQSNSSFRLGDDSLGTTFSPRQLKDLHMVPYGTTFVGFIHARL